MFTFYYKHVRMSWVQKMIVSHDNALVDLDNALVDLYNALVDIDNAPVDLGAIPRSQQHANVRLSDARRHDLVQANRSNKTC